jgi:L-cystine uptake protein TcyP (sodium:dicarboxylate symporter family)
MHAETVVLIFDHVFILIFKCSDEKFSKSLNVYVAIVVGSVSGELLGMGIGDTTRPGWIS